MSVCMLSFAQTSQNVSYSPNDDPTYSIVMDKQDLLTLLGVSSKTADKMDAWQNALQEKINEAVKLQGDEKASSLHSVITESMKDLRSILDDSYVYSKYSKLFRATIKNNGLAALMK